MPPSFGPPGQPVPAQLLTPWPSQHEPAPVPQPEAHQPAGSRYAPPAPAQRPASTPRPTTMFTEPSRTDPAQPASAPSTARSLFDIMTGIGRGRRSSVSEAEPQRAEPSFPGQPSGMSAMARQEAPDVELDIPTFLRRQKS